MTRLSDLTEEPITPQALNTAIRKDDPTLRAAAVALREAWAEKAGICKARVDAENELVRVRTQFEQLAKVMGAKPDGAMQDLTALLTYAKRVKEVHRLLLDNLAVLQQGADQNVVAAANSLEAMITAVEVPPVVTR